MNTDPLTVEPITADGVRIHIGQRLYSLRRPDEVVEHIVDTILQPPDICYIIDDKGYEITVGRLFANRGEALLPATLLTGK